MAGLDPAIPLSMARLCPIYRDRRVKPGDDGGECDILYPASGSHRNPSPQRVIRPHEGDGKCVPQHNVPVSQ
jgi:hypothetical protein